jgi:hypothetical protein
MKDTEPLNRIPLPSNLILQKLTLEQVKRIDEMLDEVGEYGEVHIIVQRGELRYINKVESYKLWDKEDKD